MPCFKPLEAYRGPGGSIVFNRHRSVTRVSMSLPCGRCIGCRMEKARQWGMRCLHEAKCWPENSYITLTYNDEFLPPGGTLSLRDVQLFMKRLRKHFEPQRVRFFLGAEYGENNGRPHYHALLFNCGFRDKLYLGKSPSGQPLYTSRVLSDLWSQDGASMGHHSIGDVTFESAVYCAKYALKKVNGDKAYEAYQVWDENGVVFNREPEFAVMSRRPGIGSTYYERFGNEVRALDNVIINGKEVRPPKFYQLKHKKVDGDVSPLDKAEPLTSEFHRRNRKRQAIANADDNTPDRLAVKHKIALIAAKEKEKKL